MPSRVTLPPETSPGVMLVLEEYGPTRKSAVSAQETSENEYLRARGILRRPARLDRGVKYGADASVEGSKCTVVGLCTHFRCCVLKNWVQNVYITRLVDLNSRYLVNSFAAKSLSLSVLCWRLAPEASGRNVGRSEAMAELRGAIVFCIPGGSKGRVWK